MEALELYSEAIRLLPSCAAYYGNRSATYMMLQKYSDALADAQQSTSIDKEFTKVRICKLLIYKYWMNVYLGIVTTGQCLYYATVFIFLGISQRR